MLIYATERNRRRNRGVGRDERFRENRYPVDGRGPTLDRATKLGYAKSKALAWLAPPAHSGERPRRP